MNQDLINAQAIIELLGLRPLEGEGGMALRTYESAWTIDGKPAGTAIYYLLSGDAFSHLHRLSGDEVYHFYLGDPVSLLELLPDGSFRTTILGPRLREGHRVQYTVPAGHWQGSRLLPGGHFALLGTTMCPGYTPESYEHGDGAVLKSAYPRAAAQIERLVGPAVFGN